MDNFLTSDELRNSLGSFWTEYFSDEKLMSGVLTGIERYGRQLEYDMSAATKSLSIQDAPLTHVERWHRMRLRRDRETGSYYPVTYSDSVIYGGGGAAPLFNKEFKYGDDLGVMGLTDAGPEIKNVITISDSITAPKTILVRDIDFIIEHGHILFIRDIMKDAAVTDNIIVDTESGDDIIELWGFWTEFEDAVLSDQWGYLIGYQQESSEAYRGVLWALWRARYHGMKPEVLTEVFSAGLEAPLAKDHEYVEDIVSGPDNYSVITNMNVYSLPPGDTPAVNVGNLLQPGDYIGTRVKTRAISAQPSIRKEVINVPPDYTELEKFASSTILEYILIEAPATPRQLGSMSEVTTAAIKFQGGARYDVHVEEIYRPTPTTFTLKIKPQEIQGGQNQLADVEILSAGGELVFTNVNTAPNQYDVWLYYSEAHLVSNWPDALNDNDGEVTRVALIGLFPDVELGHISRSLEGLKFVDDRRIGVDVYTADMAYDVLEEFGAGAPARLPEIDDYDVIIVDTLSGLQTASASNVPIAPKALVTEAAVDSLTARVSVELEAVKADILRTDSKIMWAMAQTAEDDVDDTNVLYAVVGRLGTPDPSKGTTFYTRGKFGLLAKDKVQEAYDANSRRIELFRVPSTTSYKKKAYAGKSTRSALTPVFTQPVTVSSAGQELVTTLDTNKSYVYKIKDVKNA